MSLNPTVAGLKASITFFHFYIFYLFIFCIKSAPFFVRCVYARSVFLCAPRMCLHNARALLCAQHFLFASHSEKLTIFICAVVNCSSTFWCRLQHVCFACCPSPFHIDLSCNECLSDGLIFIDRASSASSFGMMWKRPWFPGVLPLT